MRLPIFRRWNKALLVILLLVGGQAQNGARANDSDTAVEDALKLGASRQAPVIVDFYAPWCYSCYFMAKHVKTGPEWTALEKKAVIVELDADSPAGARWMQQWTVKGLPSYIVLDASGQELGRIPLERTRAQFYPEIAAIIARGSDLDKRKSQVKDGGKASLVAARSVLQAYAARADFDGAHDWLNSLPAAARKAVDQDADAALWQSRLALRKASVAKDAAACAAAAPAVLAGDLGCDRAYELDRALQCTASLPAGEQQKLYAAQQPVMNALLAKRVFIATPSCADARSLITTTADLAATLGDKKREAAVLEQAIADAERRLGGAKKLDLKRDRNLADNLRLYLDLAKRYEALDALFPKLIAAYPDDYVYAFRYGRNLIERGEPEKALSWLAQAAPKAYGLNRLTVAQYRADALVKLGRREEAKVVVAEALKANGPFFPEQVAKLKAAVA